VVDTKRIRLTRLAVVALGILIATTLHFSTPPSLLLWHFLFQRLYYLPIVYCAIYFGWRGGLAASAVSACCYIPHILTAWHHMRDYAMNQYAEIIVFFLVGAVTGVLADRERRQREQLEAATEQLKRADRLSAIGQLSAGLAHEIRNPLASIEGAADILDQPQTSDQMRREFIGIIRKETRRLNGLLGNLLDFARPRRPEFQEVDVERLIDSVTALVEHTAGRTGVRIVKRIAEPLPAIELDPEQLKQVILNLTINAMQAMPEGGEIEITAGRTASDLVLSVRDQGKGIPPGDLEKIFDPFYTTKESGTGLGLAVAHQIVTGHGGRIEARPNPEGGMTFQVVLPLKRRVAA
jgi:two-component system, NtrC family, sensor histidine kinase HydH